MENAVSTWDFTYHPEDASEDQPKILALLKQIAKKWCFQLEKGEETGREHYQGRMSLKVKERLRGCRNKWVGAGLERVHLSPTSTINKSNNFYVTKEETRVKGPWSDEDPVIPKDVQEITLWPWQEKVKDSKGDGRTINVLYDPEGAKGKSTLVRYLCTRKMAQKIPATIDKADDLMQWVMSFPENNIYFMDMPRGIDQTKVRHIYAALEEIAGGYAYDKRYHGREMWFLEKPSIWVLCNILPDRSLLTPDRWKVWKINNQKELVNYQ